MSLLEAVVLPDVMEVVSADDDRPLHLLALNYASQDSPPDAHIASERALLVDVCSFTCLQVQQMICCDT